MTDPAVIAHFRDNPAAMRAFDDLAGRRGQALEAAFAPPGFDMIPDDDVLVRYSGSEAPCAVIHADGTITDLEGDR